MKTYLELAEQAGIALERDWAGRPSKLVVKDSGIHLCGVQELEIFAELVANQTRQQCQEQIKQQCVEICQDHFMSDGHWCAEQIKRTM